MSFLHPWMLFAGLAAVALPVAIHYLTRPRPLRLPLSTIRFVREAVQQKRARYRLRDLLVLLLRAAAVVLLAWAFARPLTGAKPLIVAGAPGRAARVVLLDASRSMSASGGGTTAFDRGRAAAGGYLQYQPDLRADLMIAAAKPTSVFESPSTNLAAMREALTAAKSLPQRLDVQGAINRAAELLAKGALSPDTRLELIIISDFQRTSWATADFSPVPKGASIQFESVAPSQVPENLALLRVGARGRIEQGRDLPIEVDVGNYSHAPRQVEVDVTAGDATCRLSGLCPPGVKSTLTGTITPRMPGWIAGEARLSGIHDALPADDARPFVMNVRRLPVYALITREPSRPHPSSSHFLERALAPVQPREGQPGERVVRIDPAQIDRDTLSAASLLVVDHPGKLSADAVKLMTALLRRGRGMLYVASEPADATNLKMLADAAGSDLKMPVEFSPPPAGQQRRDLFPAEWRKDQAPFDSLGQTMNAVAGTLRFAGGLSSRRLEGGLIDDIVASFSDRSACLVVTPCGAGTLAVLNADLAESDLPASSLFVPLVGELCGRLLAGNAIPDASPSGEPFAAYLPGDSGTAAGLTILGPGGATLPADQLTEESGFVVWRSDAANPPGVYQVNRGATAAFAVATDCPPSESDLEPLDPATLKSRLATGRSVYFKGAGDEPPRDQAWAWILVACAACMMGEFGVLKAFRS